MDTQADLFDRSTQTPAQPCAAQATPETPDPPEAFVRRGSPLIVIAPNGEDSEKIPVYAPAQPSMVGLYVLDPNTGHFIGSASTWTLSELQVAAQGHQLPDVHREPPAFTADGAYMRDIEKARVAMADLTITEIGAFHTLLCFALTRFEVGIRDDDERIAWMLNSRAKQWRPIKTGLFRTGKIWTARLYRADAAEHELVARE